MQRELKSKHRSKSIVQMPGERPVALTIAGSDSGGGAGIQADLRTFAALGVHGTCAITCITAQNPRRVAWIQPCEPELVRAQIESVVTVLRPAAAKTGMLFSDAIVHVVAQFFRKAKPPALLVDPVMRATSGARLIEARALTTLKRELLPLATLVTPNLHEARILAGIEIATLNEARRAARLIFDRYGCAVLLKGGHLECGLRANDVFFDGTNDLILRAPRIKGLSTHGTGCTLSAAITAQLARGVGLSDSAQRAKEFVTRAIRKSYAVGKHPILDHGDEGLD